jgi:hypothetical protein
MKKQQVTQILQETAEQEVPASLDLWPEIQARLQTQRRASRWTRWVPATRLGWTGLILAALLLFGGVAYALHPVISQVFRLFPGWQHVEEAHLAQEVNLSQTFDGVTVTLERVYADANEIVIGYTMKGPNGRRYDAYHLTLTDAAGTIFPSTVGYGVSGQSDILEASLPPGEGAYVLAFDAAAVTGAPKELDLRLVMELEELVLPPDAPSPSPTLASSPAEPPEPMVVVLEPLPTPDERAIVGPFTFDFSVPFIPGRVAEVNQTIEAAGVAVRLERVVVTPSETRAYLRFDSPGGAETRWTPIVMLKAPGDKKSQSYFAYSVNDDPPIHQCGFLAPLYERQGEWNLTVTELVGTDLAQQPSEDIRLAGPWVFHFRVP